MRPKLERLSEAVAKRDDLWRQHWFAEREVEGIVRMLDDDDRAEAAALMRIAAAEREIASARKALDATREI